MFHVCPEPRGPTVHAYPPRFLPPAHFTITELKPKGRMTDISAATRAKRGTRPRQFLTADPVGFQSQLLFNSTAESRSSRHKNPDGTPVDCKTPAGQGNHYRIPTLPFLPLRPPPKLLRSTRTHHPRHPHTTSAENPQFVHRLEHFKSPLMQRLPLLSQ